MTSTTRFQTGKLPAVMTDADWTADSELTLQGVDAQYAQFSYALTIFIGAGAQVYVYGERTSSRGQETKYSGYYAEDASTIGTLVGNVVSELDVDPKLNAAQRLLAGATGAAVDGAA